MALRFPEDPLYQLLRSEKVAEFNEQKAAVAHIDFHDCDFRGLDLRGLDTKKIMFRGAYFRGADLRGIDFSHCDMHGVSLASAQISGCLFPSNIDATEIFMSVEKGIRMRAK
jgi:uncharacterized protein YjbI with pentapeptide repeats